MTEEVDGGSNNPKYCAVQDSFDKLALTCEQVFPLLISKLFTKKIISCHEYDVARDSTQPVYDRGTDLLRAIMKKIEGDRLDFEAFVGVLHEFSEFSGLVDKLEAVILESESSITSVASILSERGVMDSVGNANSRFAHDRSGTVVEGVMVDEPDDNVSLLGRYEPQELEGQVEGILPSSGITEVAVQNRSEALVMTQSPTVLTADLANTNRQQLTTVQQATPKRQSSYETVPTFKTMSSCEKRSYNEIGKLENAMKQRSSDIETLSKQFDERSKRVEAIRAEKSDQWARTAAMGSTPRLAQVQNLKAFETREHEAQLELDHARDQLAESNVEKEKLYGRIHELQLSIEEKKRKDLETKLKLAEEEVQRIKEKYQRAKAEIESLKKDRANSLAEKEEALREREKAMNLAKDLANQATKLALKDKEMALADREQHNRELSELREKHRQEIAVYEEKLKNATPLKDLELVKQAKSL